MKRNKLILFMSIVALIALGSYAFVTPTSSKPATKIAASKAVVQMAKDATKVSTDIVTLTDCDVVFVFFFIGQPGQEHDKTKYVYTGHVFDRDLDNCPDVIDLCALVLCAKWVNFDPITGNPVSPKVSTTSPTAVDTHIDDAISNQVEDGGVATDNFASIDVFLRDAIL